MVNASAVLVRRRDEMSPDAGAALDLLTDELNRFDRLVRDLLEISREDQADDGE
jgi:signal transduction histidine kinase